MMMAAPRVVLALMIATLMAMAMAMAAPTASKRVAVFGGGPAGTSAAHYLTKAGFSVTLFEKGERLGGKCYSLHQGDDVFEMGATILTEGYTEVLALADEFGQELKKEVGHRVMDRDTGEVSKLTTLLSNDWKISIAASTAKFFALLTRFNDWIESPSLEGADPELAMPFTQWLDSHGIKNLAPLFVIPVTTYGYDSLEVIPASYALKYLNYYNFKATLVSFGLESVGVIPPWPKILVNGYQGLVEAIATSLPDVRLNVEATSVERNVVVDGAKKIRISTRDTKTGKKEQNMLFDYLVIAFPPAAPNLKTFPMTLSADESRLLSKVQYENYFSSAVHVDGMPEDPSAVFLCWQKHQVNAPLDGTPLGFIQHGPQSDLAVVWSLPADHSFTKAQVLQKLNSTFTTVGLRLKSVDVVEQWVYFPHIASQDFVGFYDDFESKQGFGSNTYYTSGFFNFEAVEYSVRHAKYTTERIIAASRA